MACHTKNDLDEAWGRFKLAVLNHASYSDDHIELVSKLRFAPESEDDSDLISWVFSTHESNIAYDNLFVNLENQAWKTNSVPDAVSDAYPEITANEWAVAMRFTALIYRAVTNGPVQYEE